MKNNLAKFTTIDSKYKHNHLGLYSWLDEYEEALLTAPLKYLI